MNRPDFFEPYPKMPERLIPDVYTLKCVFYQNGQQLQGLDLYTLEEVVAVRDELSSLFSDHRFSLSYATDGTFYIRYENEPIPKEWLKKTLVFGPPKNERTLRLVGDRIPIAMDGLQVAFVM